MSCRLFAVLAATACWTTFVPVCERGFAADTVVLEVQAGRYDRQGVPVFFELPAALRSWKGFRLTDVATGQSVPVQFERGAKPPALGRPRQPPHSRGDARRRQD